MPIADWQAARKWVLGLPEPNRSAGWLPCERARLLSARCAASSLSALRAALRGLAFTTGVVAGTESGHRHLGLHEPVVASRCPRARWRRILPGMGQVDPDHVRRPVDLLQLYWICHPEHGEYATRAGYTETQDAAILRWSSPASRPSSRSSRTK
jgi:hypothetical protein